MHATYYFFAGELFCGLRVLHPEISEEVVWNSKDNRLRRHTLLITMVLAQEELPSVGRVQTSGVLDPRFSLCILPWLGERWAFGELF